MDASSARIHAVTDLAQEKPIWSGQHRRSVADYLKLRTRMIAYILSYCGTKDRR